MSKDKTFLPLPWDLSSKYGKKLLDTTAKAELG